jgi:hypothetical protein
VDQKLSVPIGVGTPRRFTTCAQFADATLSFLREKVPGNWANLCDSVTDNFRVINPKDFRVMT